jgi:hypothetical protein
MAWFGKKMTPELVDGQWTPMLKYAKDPQSGEPDVTKAPTLKIKLPCYDGKFSCEIYDQTGSMLFPSETSGATPMDLIPKGIDIRTIIQCGGVWFANKAFGVTWKLFQAVVTPKPSMKGRCLMAIAPQVTSSYQQQAPQPKANYEASVMVEDDEAENSDGEGDYTEVTKPAPVVVAAPAPVPVVVAAPVPVVVEAPIVAQAESANVVHEVAVPAAVVAKPKKVVRKA